MKNQDIRIVMAEIDGWIKLSCNNWTNENKRVPYQYVDLDIVPNYTQDLNAIAEFRKRHLFTKILTIDFLEQLYLLVGISTNKLSNIWTYGTPTDLWALLDATPLQHCEALIKTLAPEKWKED